MEQKQTKIFLHGTNSLLYHLELFGIHHRKFWVSLDEVKLINVFYSNNNRSKNIAFTKK